MPFHSTTQSWVARLSLKTGGMLVLLVGAHTSFNSPSLTLIPPVMAQPGIGPGTPRFPPLSAADRAAVNHAITVARQVDFCVMPVALNVTNASLRDVTKSITEVLHSRIVIEVRSENPARFTLNGPAMPIGQILQSLADLTDCHFYVLNDRLLLAPEDQISDMERAQAREWRKSEEAHGMAGPAHVKFITTLVNVTVASIIERVPVRSNGNGVPDPNKRQLHFGEIPPDAQQMLQQLVNRGGLSPIRLSADAMIDFDYSDPQKIELKVKTHSPRQQSYTWRVSKTLSRP